MTDRDARFQELLDHHPRAFGLAMRILANSADAEDAVQNAYLQVVHALDNNTLPTGDGARKWLLTAVVGHCKNLRKQSNRRRRREAIAAERNEEQQQMEIQRPARETQSAELRTIIDQAVAGLNEKQRLAVALRYEQDLSYEEAADLMATSVENLRVYVQRGLDAVRRTLQTAGYTVAPGILVAELQGPVLQSPPPQLAGALRQILDTGLRPSIPAQPDAPPSTHTATAKSPAARRTPRLRARARHAGTAQSGSAVWLLGAVVMLAAAAYLGWQYYTTHLPPTPTTPTTPGATHPPPAAPAWQIVLQDNFPGPALNTTHWSSYPGGLPSTCTAALTFDCSHRPGDPYPDSWHLPGGVQTVDTWTGPLRVRVTVRVNTHHTNLSPVLVIAADDTAFTANVDALYTQPGLHRVVQRNDSYQIYVGGQQVGSASAPVPQTYPLQETWELTLDQNQLVFCVNGRECLRAPVSDPPNLRYRLALHAIAKADVPADAQIEFRNFQLEQRQ